MMGWCCTERLDDGLIWLHEKDQLFDFFTKSTRERIFSLDCASKFSFLTASYTSLRYIDTSLGASIPTFTALPVTSTILISTSSPITILSPISASKQAFN